MNLLEHPFWTMSNLDNMRLVRVFDLPSEANPFAEDGVILRIAAAPGEVPYHKWPMAREGILDGIKKGLINQETIVVEASSGNTGHAMASICNSLGLDFAVVIPIDIPGAKIDVIRALGHGVSFAMPNRGETGAACARRLGAQEGWHNPDQYAGEWNPRSHETHLAPQLFGQTPISIFVAPGGTMGTCIGIARYARVHALSTKVVPVVCAEGEEVPAVRTLARVKKDIRQPWEQYLDEADIQSCTRREAFRLSFATWQLIPVQLGPSFGAALAGALKFIREHKTAGTLDQFRDSISGEIYTVVFGPDDYRPYTGLYLGERLYDASLGSNLLNFLDDL